MPSWGTIKSLLIFFGPFFVPKIISYYRKLRNQPRGPGQTVRPVPAAVQRSLFLLAAVGFVFLAKLLPVLSPENVFVVTNSRLQAPTDVLFSRLASLREGGTLTPLDEALRAKFVNIESRLLYLAFGPDALGRCPFCASDQPSTYLYYALPDVLAPHLVNAAVLTLATSSLLTAGEGTRWRTPAILASVAAAAADAYLTCSYNYQANSRALRLGDLDLFYWRVRRYRAFALAGLNLVFATLIWLSSTRRAFFDGPSPAERVDAAARNLAVAKSRLNALGIVKNTASRDQTLRARSHAYWSHEVGLMHQAMEDRDVVEGIKDALTARININTISADAESYASAMMKSAVGRAETSG